MFMLTFPSRLSCFSDGITSGWVHSLSISPTAHRLFKPHAHAVEVTEGQVRWPPPPPTGTPNTQTRFSLKCGHTACTFDLKLYKFDPDKKGPKKTSSKGSQGMSEGAGPGGDREGDKVLLQSGGEGGVAGDEGGSPRLPKKRPNTSNVQIDIEPTTETSN